MTLKIELNEADLPIVNRMKKQLLKSFNETSCNDVEKAVELANYLVAMKRYEEAQLFLESFVYLDPNAYDLDLWVTNAQGLVLLVYIMRVTDQSKSYDKYISILIEHDIYPSDIGCKKWVKMHLEDHDKTVNYALGETHKYKCAYLGQEVLSFMYFYETLCVRESLGFWGKGLSKKIESTFFSSQALLVDALIKK